MFFNMKRKKKKKRLKHCDYRIFLVTSGLQAIGHKMEKAVDASLAMEIHEKKMISPTLFLYL